MDDIWQKKLNTDRTLNFNRRLYRQSLNKKFGTHIHKSTILRPWKNKPCGICCKLRYQQKTFVGVKKLALSQNKRTYNPETFENNYKIHSQRLH